MDPTKRTTIQQVKLSDVLPVRSTADSHVGQLISWFDALARDANPYFRYNDNFSNLDLLLYQDITYNHFKCATRDHTRKYYIPPNTELNLHFILQIDYFVFTKTATSILILKTFNPCPKPSSWRRTCRQPLKKVSVVNMTVCIDLSNWLKKFEIFHSSSNSSSWYRIYKKSPRKYLC